MTGIDWKLHWMGWRMDDLRTWGTNLKALTLEGMLVFVLGIVTGVMLAGFWTWIAFRCLALRGLW